MQRAVLVAIGSMATLGCGAILGIEDHTLASDGGASLDASGDMGSGSSSGGVSEAASDAPTDASIDTAAEAGDASGSDASSTTAPRPLAPLSSSRVTSRTPTLHWALPSGVTEATVQICSSRTCSQIISSTLVAGTTYVPAADLPTGVVYWRLHPGTSTSVTSATWQFTVGARSAAKDTSWGTTLDVNGDGFADFVVGAALSSNQDGAAYLYLGGVSLPTTPSVTLTGTAGQAGEFGYWASSAGDVNGDGYADLLVSAPLMTGSTGVVYLYKGGSHGIDTTPATILVGPGGAGGVFGVTMAGVGDVNGDGYGDVAVGAFGAASTTGAVYVYAGSVNGLATTPMQSIAGPGGEGWDFGADVDAAGDVNADGYGDVIVGAPANIGADGGATSNSGNAYVFLGSASGLLTSPTTISGAVAGSGAYFGAVVATAGDVNGDGYADVIVGAQNSASGSGAAYVYLGGSTGVSTASPTPLSAPVPGSAFGNDVASAGDLNRDGFSDVIVGAPLPSSSAGAAYVYFGGAGGLGPSPMPTSVGSPTAVGSLFGSTAVSAGDIDDDGYSDLLLGAYAESAAYVYLSGSSGLASPVQLTGGAAGSGFGGVAFGATN